MLDLRRRQFITLLGGAAGWPLAVRANQATCWIVNYITGLLTWRRPTELPREGWAFQPEFSVKFRGGTHVISWCEET